MGVQLFAGKFSYCRDKITEIHSDPYLIPNKSACLQNNDTLEWFTPMVNFDNVLNGYLSLFQVVRSILIVDYIIGPLLFLKGGF